MAYRLVAFHHCTQALSAERLLNRAPIYHYHCFLQIRFKSPISWAQWKTTIMTKSCRFSTWCTLCHFVSFPYQSNKS